MSCPEINNIDTTLYEQYKSFQEIVDGYTTIENQLNGNRGSDKKYIHAKLLNNFFIKHPDNPTENPSIFPVDEQTLEIINFNDTINQIRTKVDDILTKYCQIQQSSKVAKANQQAAAAGGKRSKRRTKRRKNKRKKNRSRRW
jgi:hypothetical protein